MYKIWENGQEFPTSGVRVCSAHIPQETITMMAALEFQVEKGSSTRWCRTRTDVSTIITVIKVD